MFVKTPPQEIEEEGTRARPETPVLLWRVDQFRRLGFQGDDCWSLGRSDADLGVARQLRRDGCPLETALEILS